MHPLSTAMHHVLPGPEQQLPDKKVRREADRQQFNKQQHKQYKHNKHNDTDRMSRVHRVLNQAMFKELQLKQRIPRTGEQHFVLQDWDRFKGGRLC
jgi:hypothetical protein